MVLFFPCFDIFYMLNSCQKERFMKKIVVAICIIVFLMVIAMGGFYKFGAIPFVALKDYYGEWYSCNETEGVFVSAQGLCSEVCPNRVRIETGFCILSCPVNKILMDDKGECYSCDEMESIYVGKYGKCTEVCPNRVKHDNWYCALPCPPDKPLMNYKGTCYSCDEIDGVGVGENGKCSEICPNRSKSGEGCYLSCSADKTLMGWWGQCYSCDEMESIYVGEDGQCSEICPNRVKTSRGYCSLPCPTDDRPLMDEDGKCYSCDEIRDVDVGALPCETICPNRMIERHLVIYVNISKGSKEVQKTYCVLRQKEK